MSVPAPSFDISLEAAARQMRSLCREGETLPSWLDAGSVSRILAHVENIARSVPVSVHDHGNAAKRLNDFAVTFARFARHSVSTDGPFAVRLNSVADNLRAASAELSRADAVQDARATGYGGA